MDFTHFDQNGNAWMVDVSEKENTRREAVACGKITMTGECIDKIMAGQMKKGDVLGAARIAGIMGAKRTEELIPLCHRLNLTGVEVWFELCQENPGETDTGSPETSAGETGTQSPKTSAGHTAEGISAAGIEKLQGSGSVKAFCRTKTTGQTGVEMEALMGVQIALLTIYDMCKAVDKRMVISDVHLLSKSGGKNGDFHA